jgi:hypothetical protein
MGGLMEERGRWKFSLRDVLVAMIAFGVCFALLTHWIHVTREESRRNTCINNLKQLGLAVHNHHDVYARFPIVSYLPSTHVRKGQLFGVSPGSLSSYSSAAPGYSWGVRILPYLEEVKAYNTIRQLSNRFALPAFLLPLVGTGKAPPWSMEFDWFRCPSYTGPRFATAPEYLPYSSPSAPDSVAISNYVAMTATHLKCASGEHAFPDEFAPNGIIVAWPAVRNRDVSDGLSNTLMLCESRESRYSSWYDGTVGWVVAADCNGADPTKNANSVWMTTGGSSIQVGPNRRTPTVIYLPKSKLSTIKADREWGPSSEHATRVVNHVYGDDSVHGLNADIDPTVYLQLTTRAGAEPAKMP